MTTRNITRRDFIGGVALGAASLHLSPLEAAAQGLISRTALGAEEYPPALTGLRGSHPGSFEIAHALAREGRTFDIPTSQTDETYDLLVVGGGISGLAAARFFQDRQGRKSRILILENHDDFGGHARRNELDVDGRTLIGYGGSQTLQAPSAYSPQARRLLKELNIHVDRFYDYFDQDYFQRRGMVAGIYFDAPTFGRRALVDNPVNPWRDDDIDAASAIAAMPLPEADKPAMLKLLTQNPDYLAGRSSAQKLEVLNNMSYLDYLREHVGMPDSVLAIMRDTFLEIEGVGWEAASARTAANYGFPGTLGLELPADDDYVDEPYIHHFPDGNAGVARALVRELIPGAIPGSTMEDLVTARADYSALDQPDNAVRLRLNSTAINAVNSPDSKTVEVSYVNGGRTYRVRANHAVLACYNQILPHLCPEMPEAQARAIGYASKVPFVLGSIALRNWRAFEAAGYSDVYSPGDGLFNTVNLDFPVSIGDYRYARTPDDPIVLTGWHVPTTPGLPALDQYRAGRMKMLQRSYDDYEQALFSQLDGMLGPHGFDPERDIAAITLNRWPHGYAYEFTGVGINPDYGRDNGPHIAGRARIGRMSIANSDSEAYAYVDGAIDAAFRAVEEQLNL